MHCSEGVCLVTRDAAFEVAVDITKLKASAEQTLDLLLCSSQRQTRKADEELFISASSCSLLSCLLCSKPIV
jgi:hypothetical protein